MASEAPDQDNDLLDSALVYAARGWRVFPAHTVADGRCSCGEDDCASPGKHPRTQHGVKNATRKASQIRQWWTRWPDANVAVATGVGSDCFVLDVDTAKGGPANLSALEGEHGRLLKHCRVRTGSGGEHVYFRFPGEHLRNRAGKLAPGLDVRCCNGYVIAPPSRNADGPYEWVAEGKPSAAPRWLLDLLMTDPAPRAPDGPRPDVRAGGAGRADRYAEAALEDEIDRLSRAVEGGRNDQLNASAYSLGQLVAAGALDRARVEASLTYAATGIGLSARETAGTIRSGLEAGMEHPRTLPASGVVLPIRRGQPDGRTIDPDTGEITEDDVTPAAPGPRFQVRWAAEALQPQPPLVWTVENVAAPGTVNLWVGTGGTLKTYSLLDMLVHVALGEPWLDLSVTAGPVLVVDEESGPRRLLRRLAEVMRKHGAGDGLALAFVSLAALNLRSRTDADALDALVGQLRPSLVLLDALVDVMPGADENAAGETQPVFGEMRRTAERWGTSFQVIHHANKVGEYRGSTAIQAAIDLMVKVERVKDSDQITFTTAKTRDVEPFAMTLQPHFDTDGVERTFDLERVENTIKATGPRKFTPAESYVIQFLMTRAEGASVAEIVAGGPDGIDKKSLRRRVYDLRDRGILTQSTTASGVFVLVDFANPRRLREMLDA